MICFIVFIFAVLLSYVLLSCILNVEILRKKSINAITKFTKRISHKFVTKTWIRKKFELNWIKKK